VIDEKWVLVALFEFVDLVDIDFGIFLEQFSLISRRAPYFDRIT
jgi:hypothetical protein